MGTGAGAGTKWLQSQRTRATAATPQAPACDTKEAEDSKVERFLQVHGVKYAPKAEIPLNMINEKASLGNQAREEPIVPDSVERFAAALRRGEYLPPAIVYPDGNRVVIADGNNRHAAHKRVGHTSMPGFVIDEHTPSELIQLLTVAANNGHGATPSPKHRKKQAAHLHALGWSREKACQAAGISVNQLNDYMGVVRADARAKRFDIPPKKWAGLAETTRIALGKMPLDSVFVAAARFVIDVELDSEAARVLLRDVKAAPSEVEQLAVVAQAADASRAAAKSRGATGSGRVSSPKLALLSALGKIEHADPTAVARDLLTEHDRELVLGRLATAGTKLLDIITAIERAGIDRAS